MPESDDPTFGENPLNVQYTTKDARLLNQTETGIARAIAEESENFLERQYGRVFIVADVPFTDDAYDVGEVISDTFQREFFGDLNRTVGQSFEAALTTLNQTLADLAAEGDSDWVGKLDAVIGVIHEDEVYVTSVGKAKAYLIRGHSSTDITEGLVDTGSHSAKTFQNVVEGKLEVGDKVLLTTKELLNHFPIRDLRRTVFLHQPVKAIQKLAEGLSGKHPERFAAVIVELTTVDLISSETLSDEPNELILSAPRKHFESLQKFQPFTKDTQAAETYDKAKRRWEREFKPRLKRSAAGLAQKVRELNARRKGESPAEQPPTPPRHAAGTPETDPARSTRTESSEGSATGATGVDQLRETASRTSRQVSGKAKELWQKSNIADSNVWKKIQSASEPVRHRLAKFKIGEQLSGGGEKRVLYRNLIIAGVLILLISIGFSINAAQNRKAEAKVRGEIEQIEELQAKAEASFIFKDVPGARQRLATAERQADKLAEGGVLEDEVAGLQRSLQKSYDRINAVVRVKAPIGDFSKRADGQLTNLAQSGTSFYAFGERTPMYTFNLNGKQITAGDNPPASNGVTGSATTSNGDVLLLTDKPSIVQLDTTSGVAAPVDLGTGGKWERGVALDTVQQNAYILSPADNQVWGHTRTLSAFNRGDAYFDSKIDLKNAIDIITGAQVHILRSDGSILRGVGGKRQNFKMANPPSPDTTLNGAVALAINFANDNIFVADPKRSRVVEFTEAGKYRRQFRRDEFSKLHDIVVDDKTERLYVLADQRLWEIKL